MGALGLRWLSLVPCAVLALAGCGPAKDRAPPAPGLDGSFGEGGVRPPPVGRRDGGPRDGATTDGSTDGGEPPPGCTVLEPADVSNDFTVTVDSTTLDFPSAAAYAVWDDLDCDNPALLLGITDGACGFGLGRQLVFVLARDSIGTSVITGDNVLFTAPADTELSVGYYVPAVAGDPNIWGTCAGASGTVRFDSLGTLPMDRIRGSFFMNLTDCTLPLDQPAMVFEGVFDMTLADAFADVCP